MAQQGSEDEASEMRQQVLWLEQQQSVDVDMHQRLLSECKVYESCGVQRALENRLLTGAESSGQGIG
eukprot:12885672-Prorocentrum_lima.AAC.1